MLDRETGQFQSEQIGSFFSFAKATDEFGASLIGEARIPKRDPRLCETLLRMYQAGTLAFSFEIQVSEITEADGVAMIDAAEGNELIGMAVVSTPAYPEATALALVAEDKGENTKIRQGEDEQAMNEDQKKIAELEARLMLAEQKSENDEELRKKEEELEEEKRGREQAEAA